MEDNQVVIKLKRYTLPPVDVGAEIKAKFKARCKDVGMTESSVLRAFAENGKVEVIYNGKELMRYVAEVHKNFNQYSLRAAEDVQVIKNDIQKISSYIQNLEVESKMIEIYLENAMQHLDDFQRKYNEKITICTRVLPTGRSPYGNF
jgi:DNA repair ATPase RecN